MVRARGGATVACSAVILLVVATLVIEASPSGAETPSTTSALGGDPVCLTTRLTGSTTPPPIHEGGLGRVSVSDDGTTAWVHRTYPSFRETIEEVDVGTGQSTPVVDWSTDEADPGYLDFYFADFDIDAGLIVGWTSDGPSTNNLARLVPGPAASGSVVKLTDMPVSYQQVSRIQLSGDGTTAVLLANADLAGSNPDHHFEYFTWSQSDGFEQRTALASTVDTVNKGTLPAIDDDASHLYFTALVGPSNDRELFRSVGSTVTQITAVGSAENVLGGLMVDSDGDTVLFAAEGPFGGVVPKSRIWRWRSGSYVSLDSYSPNTASPVGMDATGDVVVIANNLPMLEVWKAGTTETVAHTGAGWAQPRPDGSILWAGPTVEGDGYDSTGLPPSPISELNVSAPCGVGRPGEPSGVQVVPSSCFDSNLAWSAEVTWGMPADTGGLPVIGWRVRVLTGAMSGFIIDVPDPAKRSQTVAGLALTAHAFGVYAITPWGVSLAPTPLFVQPPTTQCTTTPPTPTFPDVPTSHPFFDEIEWMVANKVTAGYPNGRFGPADPVNRASMSAFMYRLAGSPAFSTPSTPSFPDVPKSHPFFKEIEWMVANKVTAGYPNGRFGPADPVNRASMSAFMYRLAGSPAFSTPSTPSFPDVPKSHPFFKEIEWMAANGITAGNPSGTYAPRTVVNRGSMSAFMYRLNGLLAGE